MKKEIVLVVDMANIKFSDDIVREWNIKLASLTNLSDDAVPKLRVYPGQEGEIFIDHNGV